MKAQLPSRLGTFRERAPLPFGIFAVSWIAGWFQKEQLLYWLVMPTIRTRSLPPAPSLDPQGSFAVAYLHLATLAASLMALPFTVLLVWALASSRSFASTKGPLRWYFLLASYAAVAVAAGLAANVLLPASLGDRLTALLVAAAPGNVIANDYVARASFLVFGASLVAELLVLSLFWSLSSRRSQSSAQKRNH